jgi:hypothetical protein
VNYINEIPSTATERRERKDRFYDLLRADDVVGDWTVELQAHVNGTEQEMRAAMRWVLDQYELLRKEVQL